MPRIELSVNVDAPVETTYAVAKDVEQFPSYMSDLQSLTVLERHEGGNRTVTAWVGLIREFRMTIKWTQEDIWDDERRSDTFKLIQGDMDRMEGTWKFTTLDDARTRFDSVVEYEYDVPLIGPMVRSLIKKKMTENLQSTMDAIKRRAEETSAR